MNDNFNLQTDKNQIDDIFEVSISSKKLISILKKFEDNYTKLQQHIQRVDDYYKEGDMALNKKIINIETNIKNVMKGEFEHIKTEIQLDMRKYEEKYFKQLHDKESKINELKYSLQTLNDKINKVNSHLTEEIQNSVRILSQQNFSTKRNLETNDEANQATFDQIFDKLQNCKNDINDNKESVFQMEIKVKKFTELFLRPSQVDIINCPQKKFQESINAEKYAYIVQKQNDLLNQSRGEKRSVSKQKSRSKKPISKSSFNNTRKLSRIQKQSAYDQKPANTQNYMSTLQYASISAKVQSLQKTLQQKTQKLCQNSNSQLQPSLFKRGVKTSMMKTFSYSKEEFEKCMDNHGEGHSKGEFEEKLHQIDDLEILEKILNKLEMIEKSVDNKEKTLKKSVQEIKEKEIISSEKIDFIKQKINKINSDIAEIKIKLVTVQKKTGQSSQTVSISNIQTQLGKIIQRLDKQAQTKVQIEDYNKEKVKITEKFLMIQQNLIEKAEKTEVKKAINFLQDKVKEIILVMANEFNDQKLGAINKQPVKCLTCDKETLKLENLTHATTNIKGLTSSKSSRDLTGQKYFTRLLKSKNQNNGSTKRMNNYTSVTQVTEEREQNGVSFS